MPKLWDYPLKKAKQVQNHNRREILERVMLLGQKRQQHGESVVSLSRKHADPEDGSFFVARSHWPAHRFIKVNRVMARGTGMRGRAWGKKHAKPSKEAPYREIQAAGKRGIWRRVSQREIAHAALSEKALAAYDHRLEAIRQQDATHESL